MVLYAGMPDRVYRQCSFGNGINTNAASDERVWNLGTISMNYNAYRNGVWKLDFKSASEGFVKEQDMTIADADVQLLYAGYFLRNSAGWSNACLVAGTGDACKIFGCYKSFPTLKYPLHEFENGNVHVRLQINGVENTVSEIYIQ